jgi:hypothetical protein
LANVDLYVIAHQQAGGLRTVAQGKSDQGGHFSTRFGSGDYRVMAESPGYHVTEVDFTVGREDTRQQIVMRAASLPPAEEEPVPVDPDRPDVDLARPDHPPFPPPREPAEPRPFDPDMPRGDQPPREPGEPGVLLTLSTVTGRSGQRQPVPGVEVFVIRSQRTVGQGRSDSRGQFQTRVEPGTCVVFAERPGYELTRLDLQIGPQDVARDLVMRPIGTPDATRPTTPPEVEPAPGQPPRPIQPGAQMLTLQMQTVERDDRGVRPVPGPQIRIMRGAGEYAHGQADPAGRFQFRLPAGTYELQVRREGYRDHREALTLANRNVDRQVVLARLGTPPQPRPPQPRPPQPRPPHREATVNLQVVERGPDGGLTPIPAARVTINFAGKPVKEGPTDRAGTFATRLTRGLYEVAASKPGYHPNRQGLDLQRGDALTRVILFREARPPEPPKLQQVRPLPLEPMPTRRVTWQLTVGERGPDGGTFPVPNATVEVGKDQSIVFKGQTDPKGQLSTQLPSGQLRVAVAKSGYQTHQTTIELQSGPVRTQVTLQRGR